MSYVTLNGMDERDYIGNVSWFANFTGGWNLALHSLFLIKEDGAPESLMPSDDDGAAVKDVTLMLQTGYPFIGMPSRSFRDIKYSYEGFNSSITHCPEDDNFGFCYWNQSCESLVDVLPRFNLSIGINENYTFEMPLHNLMTNYLTGANEYICRL